MKSSSSWMSVKNLIYWLRWAAVLALAIPALDTFVFIAMGPEWRTLRPAPLTVVVNFVSMVQFQMLRETTLIVVVATIAPRFRLMTAIILAAVYVRISLMNQVLTRVSLVDLVLFQGGANYTQFLFETLGILLGVVYVYRLEKANETATPPYSQSSIASPRPVLAGADAMITAGKTMIYWLRWVAVLAFVCSGLSRDATAIGPQARAVTPMPLALLQNYESLLIFYVLRETAVVVPGAIIAPRFHRITAIILSALSISISFWGHVLVAGGPWWSWTINYTHFTLEVLGALIGVAYIFWLEREKVNVVSVAPDLASTR